MKKLTLIIIPSYNEGKNIMNVINRLPKEDTDVLVIDDCSTDNTETVLKKNKISYMKHRKNMGKGKSLLDGFDYGLKKGYKNILTMDADGEHKPEEVDEFIDKIKRFDFVIGERKQYRTTRRRLINYYATFWFKMVISKITDMYCGFRIIRTDLLKKMKLSGKGFELEPEMILEAAKMKARIGFVTIKTNPLEKSHFKFKDYIKTNNLFDNWILKNHKYLNIGLTKRLFLLVFAHLGLFIFRKFE